MSDMSSTTSSNAESVTIAGTTQLPAVNPGGNLGNVTAAAVLAWATTQAQDVSALPVLSSVPSDSKVLLLTSSGLSLVASSLLGGSGSGNSGASSSGTGSTGSSSSGTGGSTAPTAPSQVGSLAAGTPTASSIPVTYTAATGTPTITYAGQTSPHGANAWTANAGTFTATDGTFTALSAGTSYDLRVVATNGAGSTDTDLTAGVSTAADPASGGNALVMTDATYADRGDGSGKQMLTGGSGSATVQVADGNFVLRFRARMGTGSQYNDTPFMTLTDANGDIAGVCVFANQLVPYAKAGGYDGHAGENGNNIQDGTIQDFALEITDSCILYAGTTNLGNRYFVGGFTGRGPMALFVSTPQLPGLMDLAVYGGTVASPGPLQFTYPLNGSGAAG